MKAIGIMSGTSLDGIDICVVNINQKNNDYEYNIDAFETFPYDELLVNKIKECSSLINSNVQKICSLNFEITEAYQKAIDKLIENKVINMNEIAFIAMHGQTIWHNPDNMDGYASSTLQIGEPSVLAYKYNKTVISNFRVMDMAAGGSGAPLIPFVDYLLYKNDKKNIALQNIGGIGNVCYLKKNCTIDDVIAFDTGPGNMLIDGAMKLLYDLPYDEDGKIAMSGKICNEVLNEMLNDQYFEMPYPKSTGREKYNDNYLKKVISDIKKYTNQKEDIITTITAFTAYSITKEYEMFLGPIDELIVSGGGSHNKYIIKLLEENLKIRVKVENRTDAFEAFGFAILGHMTMLHKPSNVRSVTGAKKNVVLGTITFPPCEE